MKVDFRAYSAASQSLLDSVEKVQDDANVFRVTVTDVWGNGSNLFKLLDKCDVSTVELLLVARLGLEGVDCLRHAIHTVPEGFLTTREKFITDMVNKVSPVPLSQEECRELIKFFAGHKLHSYTSRKMEYTSYEKEMWELTKESGVGCNAFLAPPVIRTMLETRM